MSDLKFGLNVAPVASASQTDFEISINKIDGSTQNHNPYGGAFFDNPAQMVSAGGYKITSIPSPYARMHLTDIAFREYATGATTYGVKALANKPISEDYKKAMSHCLDMFELMFNLTDLDLLDYNIKIKYIKLITPDTPGLSQACNGNPNLRSYIDTLQLFRDRYNSVIQSRVAPGKSYKYNFTTNYIFKYKEKTFASTSPFSGFFTTADCNLVDANGDAILVHNRSNGTSHKLLTSVANDWQLFAEREQEFLDFLYLLLKDTGLNSIYVHLFKALTFHVDTSKLNPKNFADEYPDFNLGPKAGELPQVLTRKGNVYVRPNNFDRCYLKYILYLESPFDFSVPEAEFEKEIKNRISPDGTKNMPWLTVNDLLADSLMVLPYDVDDKYEAIEYEDLSTHRSHRRCLIPIKQEVLNYIDIEDVIKGLKIKRYAQNHYSVNLTLELNTGGEIQLRRDYYDASEEKGICCYPNGVVLQGNPMKQFVFGIYPFVKSNNFENIYKIMFYNDIDYKWSLDFYYNIDGGVTKYPDDQVLMNKTNTIESGGIYYPHNCTYYHVAGGDIVDANNNKIGINFAELKVKIPVKTVSNTEKLIDGQGLILPRLKNIQNVDHRETAIAIDLGTSNTYMAYIHDTGHAGASVDIKEFTTIHGQGDAQYLELEFMHKDNDPRKVAKNMVSYYQDSILLDTQEEALSAQLSEFIPSRIVEKDAQLGFRFPIPSVINRLRSENGTNGDVPLLHRAIPFAYYSIGWRRNEAEGLDIDNIAEGTFKWFYGKNSKGIYATDSDKKDNFLAFMTELLFIVRCNMLCNGYDLSNCKILWTYPLSFQKELVNLYTKAWEVCYCQYFHPEYLNPQKDDILAGYKNDVRTLIKSTNESLTPFFACIDDPTAVHHLNLVIDMGGGSTDVIGYRNNKAEFVTSFGFAGNSLYLDGNLNHKNIDPKQNYMSFYVKEASETLSKQSQILAGTRKISDDTPISSLMNYGFSQNPSDFENIFCNSEPKFMLQLHNAALFYHIAQVTKSIVPDEMPVNIYLTGNGSKLISMGTNNSAEKYLIKAFEVAYNATNEECRENINISPYDNPKAATAYGALKGYKAGTLSFNDAAKQNRVVAFGDDSIFEQIEPAEDGIPTARLVGKENRVYENVKNFIDVFYSAYGTSTPIISKEELLKALDFVKNDEKNKVSGDMLSDSLFFQYISLLMEQVSVQLLRRKGN